MEQSKVPNLWKEMINLNEFKICSEFIGNKTAIKLLYWMVCGRIE